MPATDSGPKPGDFPLGSPESRAAARNLLERKGRDTGTLVVYDAPKNSKLVEDNEGRWTRVIVEPAEGAEKPLGQTEFEGVVYEVYGDASSRKLYLKVGTEPLPHVRLGPVAVVVRLMTIGA